MSLTIPEDDESGSECTADEDSIKSYTPAEMAKDSGIHQDLLKQGRIWEHPVYKCLFKEVPERPGHLLCLPTRKFVWTESDGSKGTHDGSQEYHAQMKIMMLAVDMFGPFNMKAIPDDPYKVPSLAEMQKGYGERIPAYDIVAQYLPLRVHVTNGRKGTVTWVWHCQVVMGMAAVFWDGNGGPSHFRGGVPQGPLLAKWEARSEVKNDGHRHVRVPFVCDDPEFSQTSKVHTEKLEIAGRSLEEAQRIQEHICIYRERERERTHT